MTNNELAKKEYPYKKLPELLQENLGEVTKAIVDAKRAAFIRGLEWKGGNVKELNAAQVLAKFMWNKKFPKEAITMNRQREIEIDETVLLPYLMDFQRFIFEYNEYR